MGIVSGIYVLNFFTIYEFVTPLIYIFMRYSYHQIRGLITIGLFSAEEEKVRRCFRLLNNIRQQVMEEDVPNVEMRELSMGMSSDLEIAIEEGATIVRVGTAIFGWRIYPDSYYWNESKG